MCAQHCKPVKNRPEDDYLLVETCSLHITLCNKNSCADVQISITIRWGNAHRRSFNPTFRANFGEYISVRENLSDVFLVCSTRYIKYD